MSWTSLKNGIATVIKTNGNQEITGNALQGVLNSMVNALGAHATFAGIAIPSTNPGTPDGPVFYFALQAGSYSNFGTTPFVISEDEFGIFEWNGTTWSTIKYTLSVNLSEIVSKLNTLGLKIGEPQAIPVTETGKYINLSGGVGNAVSLTPTSSSTGFCYRLLDISAGDVLIVNGTGGSSPRLWGFIDSNNILLSVAAASTTATNLELIAPNNASKAIINDNSDATSYVIRMGSKNVVLSREIVNNIHSGGTTTVLSGEMGKCLYEKIIKESLSVKPYITTSDDVISFPNKYINSSGKWVDGNNQNSVMFDINGLGGCKLKSSGGRQYAFITGYDSTGVIFCNGCSRENYTANTELTIPSDAAYIYFYIDTDPAPTVTITDPNASIDGRIGNVESGLQDIESELDEVFTSEEKSSSVTREYDDEIFTHVIGQYCGRYGWQSDNALDTYYFVATENIKVYLPSYNGTYTSLNIFNNGEISSSNFSANYTTNAANIPSSISNAVNVTAGQVVAICINNSTSTKFTLSVVSSKIFYALTDNVLLPNADVSDHLKNVKERTTTGTIVILSNKGLVSVETAGNPTIYGQNRFNFSNYNLAPNADADKLVRTKTGNKISVARNGVLSYNMTYGGNANYTAEFTGKIFISFDADCTIPGDSGCRLSINGTAKETVMGRGRIVMEADVVAGDTVGLYFIYSSSAHSKVDMQNTIEYSNIMVQYGCVTDFFPYENGGVYSGNIVKPSMILSFATSTSVKVKYQESIKAKSIKHVALGDSITGMFGYGTSYPEIINRKSEYIQSYNCGFSGSQLTTHQSASYAPFSLNKLVDAIVSGDWTDQDAVDVSSMGYYGTNLQRLEGIDFTKVDFVTILMGTNDWGNVTANGAFHLEHEEGDDQETSVEDAIKYCIEQLMTAFPKLKIMVLTPYWRSIDGTKDSNVDANAKGEYLYDYADTIQRIASQNYNLKSINLYRDSGSNKFNAYEYTTDGTHPTYQFRNAIAKYIIDEIEKFA